MVIDWGPSVMIGLKNTASSGSAKRFGETWTSVNNNNYGWTAIDCTTSGSSVYAAGTATTTGNVYAGASYGSSWKSLSVGNYNWSSVASSSDGNVVLATVSQGSSPTNCGLWTITGGASVAQVDPTVRKYSGAAISDNGTYMYAVSGDGTSASWSLGYIYVSSNGGTTWTQKGTNQYYSCIVCSPDGSTAYAAAYAGDILKTTNYGSTWTALRNPGGVLPTNGAHYDIAASSDMQTVVVACNSFMYISRDGGSNFSQLPHTAISGDWRHIRMSSDGKRMIVYRATSNQIWVSNDSGYTWQKKWNPSSQQAWIDLAISNDGKTMYGATTSGIYKSTIP